MALNSLGNALRQVRRFDEAITAHQQAGDIYRETGDRHGEGMALGNLGLALRNTGCIAEARRCWVQAAEAFADSGSAEEVAAIRALLDRTPAT